MWPRHGVLAENESAWIDASAIGSPDGSTITPAIVKPRGNILVAITPGGQIWIDKRQVDVRSIRANLERLYAENPQGAVIIQADEESKNGLLVAVMDAAKLAGIENVSIAAEIID